jgi:hypothetical protein
MFKFQGVVSSLILHWLIVRSGRPHRLNAAERRTGTALRKGQSGDVPVLCAALAEERQDVDGLGVLWPACQEALDVDPAGQ